MPGSGTYPNELTDFVATMTSDPAKLQEYQSDPDGAIRRLSEETQEILNSGSWQTIYQAFRFGQANPRDTGGD